MWHSIIGQNSKIVLYPLQLSFSPGVKFLLFSQVVSTQSAIAALYFFFTALQLQREELSQKIEYKKKKEEAH
ncbi:unnamed protein product [Prunus armeniaca]